jgi:hypothetical protein
MATPFGLDETARVRECDPLHVAEQLLQLLHSLTLQSMHVISEQSILPSSDGHIAPPPDAASLTVRQRRVLPNEHIAVQSVHLPHAVTEQSTGHAIVPHSTLSVVLGHAMPPAEVGTAVARVRCRAPVPQVAEHGPQTSQTPTEQSTGHVEVAQAIVPDNAGHVEPPSLAAVSTNRDRRVSPLLQLAEQVVHELQTPTAQSTGHAILLHSVFSTVEGHAAPRPACGCATLRVREVVPESQLREHTLHLAHTLTTQSADCKGEDGASEGSSVGSCVGDAVGGS